jgi:hypothetical protein
MRACKASGCPNAVSGRHQFCETCADQRRRESNALASRRYEATKGKGVRAKYRTSGLGRVIRANSRRTEKGKEGQRRRSQRWADRHPEKAAAKILAVRFHAERRQAALAAIHQCVPGSARPLEFSESVDLLKRDLWRQAGDAEDPDEADRLYYAAHLVKPHARPEFGSPLIGIGGRQDGEPASSADAAALDAIEDWLGPAGPHGPGGE